MAKYTITHTCGCERTYNLIGKHTDRERKIAWLEQQQCPDCRRQAEDEAAKAATEGMELPELEGSPKQVKWANTIRGQFIEAARKHSAITDANKAIAVLASETSAREYIDWRDMSVVDFLKHILKKQHDMKQALEAAPVPAPAPVQEAPAPKEPAWGKVAVNAQNIERTTEKGALIKMPHNSEHDGFSVWVSLKLLRAGRHSWEYLLSIKGDMQFTLKKHGQGRYNKSQVLAEKTVSAEDMAVAFGGWVDDAPRFSKPAVDPDKEEIIHHTPEKLEPVERTRLTA